MNSESLTADLVSVLDFAREHRVLKQTVFKVIKRLGIELEKRRSSDSRGQSISYITCEEGRRILEHLRPKGDQAASPNEAQDDQSYCMFYLLLLEPNYDPGRFKVGIADNLDERLRKHRCSAPLLKLIKTWPCKRLWEKTAIDCITAGCKKVHTEVFRADSIGAVVERADQFFELMPSLGEIRASS